MLQAIIQLESGELFFNKDKFALILGDTFDVLPRMAEESADLIFADPPYFLSGGGITCNSGNMVSVDKADWDKLDSIDAVHAFNKKWLTECKRILKPNGTLWISGTMHNIYSIGLALQELEYKLLNNITWVKPNPPPNLSCRYFTHSTETILWAAKNKKDRHCFNYAVMKEMNSGKQMKDVWQFTAPKADEKKHGKFPVQKPVELLKRIITAASKEGDLILDPFNGSGTTGIAAAELNRRYIGIDNVREYLALTRLRFNDIYTV